MCAEYCTPADRLSWDLSPYFGVRFGLIRDGRTEIHGESLRLVALLWTGLLIPLSQVPDGKRQINPVSGDTGSSAGR